MKSGYRKARSYVLLLAGLLALGLSHTMDGYSVVFGMSLVISAALTLVYIFIHFDETINQKIPIEMIADAFAGLVIFTYPLSSESFLLVDFAFWIVLMGAMTATSGLMEEKNKEYMWVYALAGIVMIVLGFVILHYQEEYKDSVLYLLGFTLIIYTGTNLFLMNKKKGDVY
jgi:uncharacterized membrane protein HdeD (DUF308 family)